MGLRVETYRTELRRLQDWEPYLKKHSGLPGPRANLELVTAVAEEADPDRLWRFSASGDEFLALCGTAGLGRIALLEPDTVEVLSILDVITRSLAAATDRDEEGFRALRKALGYGWSVAAAAAPQNARPYFEKWKRTTDKDVAWVMKSNLGKARMSGLRASLEAAARPPKAAVRRSRRN